MNNPLIGVVIPTWNLKNDLLACVESLLNSSLDSFYIYVIDNGSTDGTVEALHSAFRQNVKVIACPKNRGFAYAVNKGIDSALQAGTEFVLILNNDTIVETHMLEHLIEAFKRRPTVGVVAPVIFYYEPADLIWRIGDRQFWGPPLSWRISATNINSDLLGVDYVTGCAMLVRKEVFAAIGKFDENYAMYFEDADFCQRARVAGFDIIVNPAAKLWHKVSKSTRHLAPKRVFDQNRSRVIFLNRHSPLLLWLPANVYIWGRSIVESGQYLIRRHTSLIKATFLGILAGYNFVWQHRQGNGSG